MLPPLVHVGSVSLPPGSPGPCLHESIRKPCERPSQATSGRAGCEASPFPSPSFLCSVVSTRRAGEENYATARFRASQTCQSCSPPAPQLCLSTQDWSLNEAPSASLLRPPPPPRAGSYTVYAGPSWAGHSDSFVLFWSGSWQPHWVPKQSFLYLTFYLKAG